jgi:hypothetical protein
MSDQPKDQNQKRRAVRAREPQAAPEQPDPPPAPSTESTATAALALAVTTAKKAATPPADSSKSAERAVGAPAKLPGMRAGAAGVRRYVVPAAAALVALVGGFMGTQLLAGPPKADPRWTETAAVLHQNQDDLSRIAGDMRALTATVEALKESSDRGRADASSGQADLVKSLERVPREVSARIGQLGPQLERIESAAKDPATKLAALAERLDRIERQIAALSAARQAATPAALGPAASPPESTATGSVEPKREAQVEGWVLHEVYNGVALIEGRNRRLIEVGPGEVVPGVGRVEAIEKRGRRWVVVTAKGVIASVQ